MAGGWGGFWSQGVSPIYGRTGPNFDKYYTMPATPPEPTFGGGAGGGTGGKPSSVGQQIPGAEKWVDPLVQRYFGNATDFDKLFWQSKEGMPFAYAHFMGQEAAPGTDYERWLSNEEGRMTANFVDASRAKPDLQYIDFIASKAQELAQRYTQLPSWRQGMNTGPWFAGRQL
jgi:hypothetical protein